MDRSGQRWAPAAKAALLVLAVALAGCASDPGTVALDPHAAGSVHRIALVEAHEPARYVAMSLGPPGTFLGAIGALFAAESTQSRANELTAALRSGDFSVARRLTDRTAEALARLGYDVVRVPEGSAVHAGADAVLYLAPTLVGYVSTYGFNDYIPVLAVNVELIRTAGSPGVRLYRDQFMFGWYPGARRWVHVSSPERYRFSSFDELVSHGEDAGRGLLLGADLLAQRIARAIAGGAALPATTTATKGI